METLLKDICYAVRSLLKRPAFIAIAVVTLALGAGANTVMFSLINAPILSPLRLTEPDRVVAVWTTPKYTHVEGFVSYLDLQDWRAGEGEIIG